MSVPELTCKELVEVVTEYLEGRMPAERRLLFEEHLAFCDWCQTYLEQMQETIWLTEELWRVELDGGEELTPGIMVAPRGRLLGRVEAWNDQTAREFARACAAHVQEHATGRAAGYAAEAAAAAEEAVAGDSATRVGYMAAHAAEAMAPGGVSPRRRLQSHWPPQ